MSDDELWIHDGNDEGFLSGWVPSPPDPRDHIYEPPKAALADTRPDLDLNPGDWPVWDQRDLPSCTAQALAGGMSLLLRNHPKPGDHTTHDWEPSRMFLYYNERAEEGTQAQRRPAHLRDAVKSVKQTGICPDALWPYDVNQYATKPPEGAYDAAKPHREIAYRRLKPHVEHMKACLKEKHPFTIGFRLFQSLATPKIKATGDIPAPTEQQLKSLPNNGHCVLVIGYDDAQQHWLIRNSYGPDWGKGGYGTLPYRYVTTPKLCADMWTVRWHDEAALVFPLDDKQG